DHKTIKNILKTDELLKEIGVKPRAFSPDRLRIRFNYSRGGDLRLIGHLEVARLFIRALKRARFSLNYSKGFHPHPKVSFLDPLPLGVESEDEYMDVELTGPTIPKDQLIKRLTDELPSGLEILGADYIPLQLPSLSAMIKAQKFIISFKNKPLGLSIDINRIDGFLRDFEEKEEMKELFSNRGIDKLIDLKPLLADLSFSLDKLELRFTLNKLSGGGVKPHQLISHILGLPPGSSTLIPIRKLKTVF
ncbi:MAG: TIGR03936 family radical SAM-associated protein, partial [Deltaproteobacteria bacterium]|nr:TIGR03936 family radical SAM-associated protein [Deltaproteobacteria bacterium]